MKKWFVVCLVAVSSTMCCACEKTLSQLKCEVREEQKMRTLKLCQSMANRNKPQTLKELKKEVRLERPLREAQLHELRLRFESIVNKLLLSVGLSCEGVRNEETIFCFCGCRFSCDMLCE